VALVESMASLEAAVVLAVVVDYCSLNANPGFF